jgi:hypothetical protein
MIKIYPYLTTLPYRKTHREVRYFFKPSFFTRAV